jgi:hypothetical protein
MKPPQLPGTTGSDARLAGQPCPKVPGAVTRLDQIAVDPEHIGHRQDRDDRHEPAEAPHGEGEIAVPIEAADAIEERDTAPGEIQAGKLGQADVAHVRQRARVVPIDAGARAAMDLVDQQRPADHRQCAGDERDQRRIGAVHTDRECHRQPGEQSDEAGQSDAMADRRCGALPGRRGRLFEIVLHDGALARQR